MVATASAQTPTVLCEMQIGNQMVWSAPQDPFPGLGSEAKNEYKQMGLCRNNETFLC